MNDTKSLLTSKTFYGAALAVLGAILGMFGYTVAPDDQVALAETIGQAAALVGGVFAIYGRIKASKPIR